MKVLKFFAHAILLILPLSVAAADKKIICEPPTGTRLDYFMVNAMNLENKKFLMARDRVNNLQPVIILHDNETEVTFYFQKENEKIDFKERNMKVIARNLQLVTFVGLYNNAPIMATYYPLFDVLIYSQQSLWPGRDFSGARSMLFYSKCMDAQ